MVKITKYELKAANTTLMIGKTEISSLEKSSDAPGIIGQPRALQAMKMGIGIKAKGYNIFVTGFSGTGKRTAIKQLLENLNGDAGSAELEDIIFVYNYRKPDRPRVLYLPAGRGIEFKKELHQVVENLKLSVKSKLESKRVQSKRDKLVHNIEHRENKLLSDFESRLAKENFHIIQMEDGDNQITDICPVYKGQAIDFDELQSLVASGEISEAFWNTTRAKYYKHMDEMKKIFRDLQVYRMEMEETMQQLNISAIEPLVDAEIDRVSTHYTQPAIREFLKEMQLDIKRHLFLFTMPTDTITEDRDISFLRYGVNVAVDNADSKSFPVIFENHPVYANLFGTVESRIEANGVVRSDFMMMRAGSLLQSSGGYLILYADDILRDEHAWPKLKNVLLTGKIEIFQPDTMALVAGTKLKSEPVRVKVKVIIIGNTHLYDYLYNMDEDFQKLFKISAEFDSVIALNTESIRSYIEFIHKIIGEDDLKKINTTGIVRIIEYGARLAEHQQYLSTRFSQIADLIREADYWAGETGKKVIDNIAVSRAIAEKNYLNNLPEEKISKLITDGDILIAVDGKMVGCINGLAVYDRGYYAFGRPSMITARIAPGDNGVINIEREAGLSGDYHDKGVLILEGFLRSYFAQDFPLSITASICFEQSYSNIDGDSASSAEIYALLSAISQVPLRQDIAVTGSVNQMGVIQPIGGVSEKVEGFYNICKARSLSGSQGVIIPIQNVKNLLLCEEVVKAIREKKFHVYAIRHINEGLEILTGMKTGVMNEDYEYPADSLNQLVRERLLDMAQTIKEFGQDSKEGKEGRDGKEQHEHPE